MATPTGFFPMLKIPYATMSYLQCSDTPGPFGNQSLKIKAIAMGCPRVALSNPVAEGNHGEE